MRDMRVALAQINCPVGELQANLSKHEEYITRAAEAGAKIICFPELSLTGYMYLPDRISRFAQALDGDLIQSILRLSAKTGILIMAGIAERQSQGKEEIISNAQVVAGPAGLIGVYRKTHIGGPERLGFHTGNELPVFHYDGLTFGLLMSYDNHFPEAARMLALQGAEVIFAPYASPGPYTEEGYNGKHSRWLRYLTARAFDNSLYVALVNQIGPATKATQKETTAGDGTSARDTNAIMEDFPGGSLVLNPWGEVIAKSPPLIEDLLILDLSDAVLRSKREDELSFFTQNRRPELYSLLSHGIND